MLASSLIFHSRTSFFCCIDSVHNSWGKYVSQIQNVNKNHCWCITQQNIYYSLLFSEIWTGQTLGLTWQFQPPGPCEWCFQKNKLTKGNVFSFFVLPSFIPSSLSFCNYYGVIEALVDQYGKPKQSKKLIKIGKCLQGSNLDALIAW